jgi:hypothetical protein
MEQAVRRTLAPEWRDYLETLITAEELQAPRRNGACNKAPVSDGICLEFFKVKHKGGHSGPIQPNVPGR